MCSSLASIPNGLFKNNTAATDFSYCFQSCARLKDFHLRIGSSSVEDFSDFVLDASNVDRILCVPANSTTYTNASNFANASNGVIVSTDFIDCAETWEFTIDTEATTAGEKKTGIPFNLYGQTGIQLTVDWGDNTTSTLTPSDYTATDTSASVHEYTTAGEYTITIISNDWENTYILSSYYNITNATNKDTSLYFFRRTLISLDNPIPSIKGMKYYASSGASSLSTSNNGLNYCFYKCVRITSIPVNLFINNISIQSFEHCFDSCSGITSIPAGLFDNNVNATTFSYCFYQCYLASIPSGLFDKNINALRFVYCFGHCFDLASIPAGLFDKNINALSFEGCFTNCYNITSIPSGLFDKNTKATTFRHCFTSCDIRTIPSGLFDNNTEVTEFSYCFRSCLSLASIPSGLFDNNLLFSKLQYYIHSNRTV